MAPLSTAFDDADFTHPLEVHPDEVPNPLRVSVGGNITYIMPVALADCIKDVLLCGSMLWMAVLKDQDPTFALKHVPTARWGHITMSPDYTTGRWSAGGIDFVLNKDFILLLRVWRRIKSARGDGSQDANDYIFDKKGVPPGGASLDRKMAKFCALMASNKELAGCGLQRVPTMDDAQTLYEVRERKPPALARIEGPEAEEATPGPARAYREYKALFVGGRKDFARDYLAPRYEPFGIKMAQHWEWKKRGGNDLIIQQEVDLVLVFWEMTGHSGKSGSVLALDKARARGIPVVHVRRKMSLGLEDLRNAKVLPDEARVEDAAGTEESDLLELQIEVGAGILRRYPHGKPSKRAFEAAIREATGMDPVDNSVFTRSKALAAATVDEPSEEPTTVEVEVEVPMVEPPVVETTVVEEPPVEIVQDPIRTSTEYWKSWRNSRIEAVVTAPDSVHFMWEGVPHTVNVCPAFSEASQQDVGSLLVVRGESSADYELVTKHSSNRKVHAAAATAWQQRFGGVADSGATAAMVAETPAAPAAPTPEAVIAPEPVDIAPVRMDSACIVAGAPEGTPDEAARLCITASVPVRATVPPTPEEEPAPVAAPHPYAEFERLREAMLLTMKQLGYTSVKIDVDGGFKIKRNV